MTDDAVSKTQIHDMLDMAMRVGAAHAYRKIGKAVTETATEFGVLPPANEIAGAMEVAAAWNEKKALELARKHNIPLQKVPQETKDGA